jgi:hypothetical protein
MTYTEIIKDLRKMQEQIINGPTIFKDAADMLEELEQKLNLCRNALIRRSTEQAYTPDYVVNCCDHCGNTYDTCKCYLPDTNEPTTLEDRTLKCERDELRAKLVRFTADGLLDVHAICDQRDAFRDEVVRLKKACVKEFNSVVELSNTVAHIRVQLQIVDKALVAVERYEQQWLNYPVKPEATPATILRALLK